jgi:hypothetical protein
MRRSLSPNGVGNSRIYRESHDTFEAFCKDEWEMSWQRAYQYIDAAPTLTAPSRAASRVHISSSIANLLSASLPSENDECFIDRGLSSAYESLNKAARGWPFASGGAESGSLKSAVQCQFLISGISSRCSRMYS